MVEEYDIVKEKKSVYADHSKNKYGQYFTPSIVAEFMLDLSDLDKESKILEPSCGEGVFLDLLIKRGCTNLTAYEIDKSLGQKFDFIKYESFVTSKDSQKFNLIIGNPPYIRWKNLENELKGELSNNILWNKYFNSLCDYLYIFILKSIELLEDNGQLIFICPEYWMNTTHSISLRNYMVKNGYFKKIYHFNETPIFSNATVSVVIFKYIKSKSRKPNIDIVKYYKNKILTTEILAQIKTTEYSNSEIEKFSVLPFEENKRWLLSNNSEIEKIEVFENSCISETSFKQDLFSSSTNTSYPTIGDVCDIGNGMVSGLDKAFQLNGQSLNDNEINHSIKVIKAKDLEPFFYKGITPYIFVNEVEDEALFKENFPSFYSKLLPQQEKLEKRYQYNREIYFWQWVFLRNYNLFNSDRDRIFVPCKERISNKNYFRFTYVQSGIFPTQDVTAIFPKTGVKESTYYILAFLNNHRIFDWLKNKGIVKGNIVEFSEKPISSIPFKKIDWRSNKEVNLHNEITELTKQLLVQKDISFLEKINDLIDSLLEKQ